MSIPISGTLYDPFGNVARFADIKFVTLQGSGDVIESSSAVYRTDENGTYSIDVQLGRYAVYMRFNGNNGAYDKIQTITVNSDVVASTLGELLEYTEPLTPAEILIVQQLAAEAVAAKDDAQAAALQAAIDESLAAASALSAQASATAAANSVSLLAPVAVNGGVWASGQQFTAYNQYMIYSGEAYSPSPATSLPYTVGATPNLSFVYQVALNDHSKLANRNAVGAHDASSISRGASTVEDDMTKIEVDNAGATLNRHIISANGTTSVLKNKDTDQATRIHIEPNGYVDNGTTAKLDLMFDDYNSDQTNYRIGAIYNKTGNAAGLNGENGAAILNVKGAGEQWGVFPSWHLGFQDDSATGVPMKAYYFDTSDTAWRTPMTGMWRTGKSYTSGDYCLSGFKLYLATTSGTSGTTKPSHSTGTVSDGVVSWSFVRDFTLSLASYSACVIFGSRDKMPLFGQYDIPVQYAGHTVHHYGFRDKWLKSGNNLLCWTGVRNDSDSYQVEMADGSSTQVFEGWRRNNLSALSLGTQVISTNSGTIDIANKEKITFSNTVSTNVAVINGGRANQIFYIESTNSNTTLVHNSQIRLKAGVNLPLTTESMVQFIRHSDGRYIQV